jgi:transcriptional regulator with XRE-family HTH domain
MAEVLAEPATYDPASRAEILLTDPASIGLALRRARRHARLSQRALAARAAVAATTVARIETGQADPTVRTLTKLLAAAGLALTVTGLEPTTFAFGIVDDKRDVGGRRPPPHRLSEAGRGYWDTSAATPIQQAISAHLGDLRFLAGVAALRASRR